MRWSSTLRPLRRGLHRTISVAFAVGGICLVAGCGRLDRDAVDTELKTAHSSAAEGMLVAEQAARSRAPVNFIEIRTAELSKQSGNVANALEETPTEAGLQETADRTREIASRASDLLSSLHEDASNANLAENVATQLRALAAQTDQLEASL